MLVTSDVHHLGEGSGARACGAAEEICLDPDSEIQSAGLVPLAFPDTAEDAREKTPRAFPPPRAGQLPPLPPGTLIDHFQIVRCLGRGGMGVVYLARDFKLGRRVALKLIDPALARSPQAVSMFLREARATACFNHPNIVTIHAVGQHGTTPYIALEYLEGQSLLARMKEQPLGFKEAIRIALGVAEALREAHAHHIVHGDLKPANVSIPADGRPRVVDFGICRAIDPRAAESAISDEAPGSRAEPIECDAGDDTGLWLEPLKRRAIVGTPAYMAPEQWAGKPVTGAADVWALGIIIGELAADWHPYEELLSPSVASTRSLRRAVVSSEPAPVPDLLGPDVPREVVELIRACLRKDPDDRPSAAQLADGLRRLLGVEGPSPATEDVAAPFPGLQPFQEQHARFFFGREAEIAAFIERLRTQAVLPVVGPSGAGKSSFIYAGVIPRLKEQGDWLVIDLRPGDDPFAALADSMVAASTSDGRGSDPNVEQPDHRRLWKELAASPPLLALKLHTLAQRRGCRVLLVVDQLEELVTRVKDPALRRAFLEAICAAATDRDDPVRVTFTLRDDYLGDLAETPRAREALGRVTVVCRPGAVELAQTVIRPVEAVGYEYDDAALPQEIVASVLGEPACLTLLQFATRMLWERRDRSSKCLRRSTYDQIGGVPGALAAHADSLLETLTLEERAISRDLLLRLVSPNGTRQVLRRDRLLEGLGPEADEVLRLLTETRLLIVKQSDDQGTAEVEIVHESLIHRWPQLARWISESKEELRFADDITRAANLWLSRGQHPEEVWGRDALRDAERLLCRCSTLVPPQVSEFLEAGRRLEQRQRRRRRALVGVGFALLLAGVTAASFAFWAVAERENVARLQRDSAQLGWAEAQREGARAALLHGDLLEARAKLREALQSFDSPAARVLWRQLRQHPLLWQRSVGSIIYDVAISPDGRSVAAAAQDRSVYLLDAATGRPRVLRGHRDQVFSVAYAPVGESLASGTVSGEILVWSGAREIGARLIGHTGAVRTLTFSPDGRRLASASTDGTVRIWDAATGKPRHVYRGHRGSVEVVAFSPEGTMLASAGADRIIQLWSPDGASPPRQLTGHTQAVNSIDFSPDGRWLATASDDHTARLWELETGKLQRVFGGQALPLRRVRFAADGRSIAASAHGGGVAFWELSTGKPLLVLGPDAGALRFGLSSRTPLMASGGLDGIVRLWDTGAHVFAAMRTSAHQRPVGAVAFSPAGDVVASGSADNTIRLWDVRTGEVQRVLSGHRDQIYGVAFSPDGKLLASASWDSTVRLWDVATGAPVRMLAGHQAAVMSVAFSPDGTRLLTGGRDRTARLWSVETGRLQAVLRDHEDAVAGVSFASEELAATASYDGKARIWDLRKGSVRATLEHKDRVHGLAFSLDGAELATACWDGSVRVWQVLGNAHRVVGKHQGRAYEVAWNGQGKLASVGADGAARVWRTDVGGGPIVELRGHRSEANDLAFSPDWRRIVTVGDDGTVRLWDVATGEPVWRGTALIGSPPRLFSHQGWRGEHVEASRPAKPHAWQHAVERSRQAAGAGSTVCLLGAGGDLEIWDTRSDLQLRRDEPRLAGGRSTRLVPYPGGCLTLGGGRAMLHRAGREPRLMAQEATGLAWDGKEILVAAGQRVFFLDPDGSPLRSLPAQPGIVALAHDGDHLVLGFEEGNVVVQRLAGGDPVSLQDITPSAVTELYLGPAADTLVVAYANGLAGIWSLRNGARLDHAQLHGAVAHLVADGARIHIATELGDRMVLDLGVLRVPYCELMRDVWTRVPVVWQNGLPVVQPAPADHACLR